MPYTLTIGFSAASPAPANGYVVTYWPVNDPANVQTVNVAGSPAVITGLSAFEYTGNVKSTCGAGFYSSLKTFSVARPATVNFYNEPYSKNFNNTHAAGYFLSHGLKINADHYFSYNFYANPPAGTHGTGNFTLTPLSLSVPANENLAIQSNFFTDTPGYYLNPVNYWTAGGVTALSAELILQVKKDGVLIGAPQVTLLTPSSGITTINLSVPMVAGSVYDVFGHIDNLVLPSSVATGTCYTFTLNSESDKSIVDYGGTEYLYVIYDNPVDGVQNTPVVALSPYSGSLSYSVCSTSLPSFKYGAAGTPFTPGWSVVANGSCSYNNCYATP